MLKSFNLKSRQMTNEQNKKIKTQLSAQCLLIFCLALYFNLLNTYNATTTTTTVIKSLNEEQFSLSAEEALESYEKNLSNNPSVKDCSSLFPRCLCSFKESTRRNYLYCNEPTMNKMPDFKAIYELFEMHVRAVHSNLNLIFSKVDFTSKF